VGGVSDNQLAGAAWVFTRSGGIWTQQGAKLVGTGAAGAAAQGFSAALSADGNTAIVGGAFDMPSVDQYGGPTGTGAAWVYARAVIAPQTAVEYYYDVWNYYFETANQAEIAALDGGAFGGAWKRTGETFKVWPSPSNPSAVPTCRFFSIAFAPKSSHFYTPFPSECAFVQTNQAMQAAWQFENIAFYIQLADTNGLCSGGTIPLYRLYNNGMGGAPNHRYTTSVTVLGQMQAAGWTFEGNGNTMVFACVPQ
jgi:hypothetical protein